MITAIIPTLNEEDLIAETIRRVCFADEILVIDSFSSDKTVEVARDLGVKVVQRKFDDFSTQKNFAIRLASYEWILIVDADERVSDDLADEILRTVNNPQGKVAFFLYRNFYFEDKRVRYGGWQTDKVMRLFKKDEARYNGNLVHEILEADGPVGFMENRLDHYSYQSPAQYWKKLDLYARLQAEELYEKRIKTKFWQLTFKPVFRFFVHYILRMGFLDGSAGFELARAHGVGVWKRYKYLDKRYSESEDAEIYMKSKL